MKVYIPPNFTNNGGALGGLVKKRNAFEAGLFLTVLYFAARLLAKIAGPAVASAIFALAGIPIGILLLTGIRGRAVGELLFDLIHYELTKGVKLIELPHPVKRAKG